MNRVIILEGPDGGGKTTLANRLVKHGWKYKHEGPPPSGVDIIDYYLTILNESLEDSQPIVHDRLWLGERIYGPICRGIDGLGSSGQVLFDRIHSSRHIDTYVCLPPIETVKVNYKIKINKSSDYLKSELALEQVYHGYQSWLNEYRMSTNHSVHLYNYETDTMHETFHKTLPRGTVGSCSANYLFIGDRPNHPHIDIPFHAITGSSGYLNTAIELAGFKESQIALSNAYSPIGETHDIRNIVSSLDNLSKVFLMGKVAQEWWKRGQSKIDDILSNHKIDIVYTEHPSYLKRFHGNNPQLLANKFKEHM